MNIRPINVRKHIEYSDEPGGGIDNRIHYALFLECSILGDHDVYTTDAQPVFMNTLGCRILEEHNSYQYDHSEGYMCSETTVTERISIAVDIPGRENEYGEYMPTYYAGWYIYDIKYDHPWAEIIYNGPEPEWTELAASDVMNGPEGDLIPLISRINTDTVISDYAFDRAQMIRLLRQLAADERIYDHVDPDDIHYRWHYLADKLAEGTIKRKKRRRQRRMQTGAPVNAEPDIFDPDFVFDDSASQEEIDLRKEQLEELRNEIETILG